MKLGLCALSLLAALSACDPEHPCTLQGCLAPLTIVLAGADGPKRDAILLNAAGAIAASGHAEDLLEGLELARRAVESGAALERLDLLVEFSRAV